MTAHAPKAVSRYEVLAKIASGGMATVFVGRARGAVGFSRMVAIKRPHPFVTADAKLRRELEHEARVASFIHHPNVVSVLDVEELENELVLVMDYVEGCTLRDLVEHATNTGESLAPIAVRIVLDVAAGLHAAHRVRGSDGALLGIVHRDVSPHNVLVGLDGVARLTDFGIAKIANAERDRTASDVLKGKTAYLPPEYVGNQTFEARSDLFSLGVVLWEALTQKRLFKGVTTVETLLRVLEAKVPRVGETHPDLAELDDVVAAALARRLEDRPASVEAFATELEARARRLGAVATHAEVGAWVDRVSGETVLERRRLVEASEPRALPEIAAPITGIPSARDAMPTLSIVAPTPPRAGATSTETPSPLAFPALADEPPTRARRWKAPALGGALAMAGVLTTALVLHARRPAPLPSPEPASTEAAEPHDAPLIPPDPSTTPSASTAASAQRAPLPLPRRTPRNTPRPSIPSGPPLVPSHAPPNPYGK